MSSSNSIISLGNYNSNGQQESTLTNNFFAFAKELLENGQKDEAIVYLKKCIEINPKNYKAYLELLLICIQDNNFDEAFNYIDCLNSSVYANIKRDCVLYLYLMSHFISLPTKYSDIIVNLNYDNVIAKGQMQVSLNDKARLSCYNGKFNLASSQLKKSFKKTGKMETKDKIIYELLNRINNHEMKSMDIMALIEERRYGDIIDFLSRKESTIGLNRLEVYILSLVKDLVHILNTGQIPPKIDKIASNCFQALDIKEYKYALALAPREGVIRVLLENIVDAIVTVEEQQTLYKMVKEVYKDGVVEIIGFIPDSECKEKPIGELYSFLNLIAENNTKEAFLNLDNYLESIDKRQYKFFFIDLIKICLKTRELIFAEPRKFLQINIKNEYPFKLSEYIEKFYQALIRKDFDLAEVYLDIISKSYQLDQRCVLIEELQQLLQSEKTGQKEEPPKKLRR